MRTAAAEVYASTRTDQFTTLVGLCVDAGVPELADEISFEARLIDGVAHGSTPMWNLERTDEHYSLAETCRLAHRASDAPKHWYSLAQIAAADRCLCTERILASGTVMTPWSNTRRATQALLATLAEVAGDISRAAAPGTSQWRTQRLVNLTESLSEISGLSSTQEQLSQLIEHVRALHAHARTRLRTALREEGAAEELLRSLRARASQRPGFQAILDERPTLVGLIGQVTAERAPVSHLAVVFDLRLQESCWVGYLPRYAADAVLRHVDEHVIVQSLDAPSAAAAELAARLWDPGPHGDSLLESYQSACDVLA